MRDQDVFLERALLEVGLLSKEQLEEARRFAAENDLGIAEGLIQSQTLTNRQIALTKADVCEVPFVDLSHYEPCYANTSIIPRNLAERHCAFPLFMLKGVLTVAMEEPLNLDATDQIRQVARCEVDPVLSDAEEIRRLIAKAYALAHQQAAAVEQKKEHDSESDVNSQPVVAAVNQILTEAVERGASDVHINPDEHELHLRYRIDGVLQEKQAPPLSMHWGIVQRLKVMSNLDLTQTRRPQDGKVRFRHGNKLLDIRVSTVPTVCGENVVLRILTSGQSFRSFQELGVPGPMVADVSDCILQPYGMVLVTGPTGSGKTTTLYTAISKLNDPSRNIMTIEDPVEIRMPYVRQIQVNHEINMTFASALRSILRQDPDVVLVGEIRDEETATIALQAALTGHLVLSTLHTNDSVGAVSRLRDFGLPPFVINSSVLGVLAQRLVRRVCQHCAQPAHMDEMVRHRFGLGDDVEGFVRGSGCGRCSHTGYRGRVGLYEFLRFAGDIKTAVEEGSSTDRIRRIAVRSGMRLMWQDGLEKARLGQTTLEEVAKVASIIDIAEQTDAQRLVA